MHELTPNFEHLEVQAQHFSSYSDKGIKKKSSATVLKMLQNIEQQRKLRLCETDQSTENDDDFALKFSPKQIHYKHCDTAIALRLRRVANCGMHQSSQYELQMTNGRSVSGAASNFIIF